MPHFDAIGITAEDLPATLAFYRLIGLDVRYATVLDPDGNPVDLDAAR